MMTKQKLINEIKTAFKGVKLEDGIGLKEGNGIDDYASKEQLLAFRKQDERENWENIPFEDICNYECAFGYLDTKGMRFLMPQYMIADILWEEIEIAKIYLNSDPISIFESKFYFEDERLFSLFNPEQIQAVIHYIEYKKEEELKFDFEQNKQCDVDDEFNKLLYEEGLENIQNSYVMQKWKQFLKDKQDEKTQKK